MFEDHSWRNEPPRWTIDKRGLHVTTAPETDFWNHTFYGFVHANGHFFGKEVAGDFSTEAVFSASYAALYDQAGVMLRVDDRNWLKTGIEFTDGAPHFSVVVTRNDRSDWSVIPLPDVAMSGIQVRLSRHDEALRVQYRLADMDWTMARLAYLDMPEAITVGPMACAPVGSGLDVTFSRFAVGPAIARELH